MNEDSRTDKAKGHLKKAIMIEKQAAEVADNDLFITRLECIQKVKILYSFLFLLSSPFPGFKSLFTRYGEVLQTVRNTYVEVVEFRVKP